ncbi:ribonuclease H family protein, partial [Staphylococcus epidermidis]
VDLGEEVISFMGDCLLRLDNVKYKEGESIGWCEVKMKGVLDNEAMKNVVEKIEEDEVDYIVIDEFAKGEVYEDYGLSALGFGEKTKFERKGESK